MHLERLRARRVSPTDLRREQLVRAPLDPSRCPRIRGAAGRRVVLDAAILGRVVRRRDDDAIGQTGAATAVVHEDGMRDDGRGRPFALARVAHLHVVRREDLERGALRRLGECVRVRAEEQRPGRALRLAVLAHRLRHREDVRLIEAEAE